MEGERERKRERVRESGGGVEGVCGGEVCANPGPLPTPSACLGWGGGYQLDELLLGALRPGHVGKGRARPRSRVSAFLLAPPAPADATPKEAPKPSEARGLPPGLGPPWVGRWFRGPTDHRRAAAAAARGMRQMGVEGADGYGGSTMHE